MYQVKLYKDYADNIGTIVHSPYINDLKLSSGQINFVIGSVHNFDFTINIKNPAWTRIEPLKTIVEVKDTLKNKVIFEGRALQPKSSMSSAGVFSKKIICESFLAYLVDSSQRHAEIHDTTVREFLQIIIDNHNKQVEPHKHFTLGDVTVTNTTDNVYRYLGYDNTYETIKDKLIDRLGGYIQARRESDVLYLDYLEDIGEYVGSTPIKLSHNMQSIEYEVDPTDVITRLVPLGESLESEDEDATDASQARLTIADVNNGIDYLDDLELQKVFGIIEKEVTWDDVTTPQRLLTNARNFFKDQKAAIARFSVDSTNSYLLGKDIASFDLGNYHDLINPVLAVSEKVQIIEKKIDINQPQKSALKIGDKFRTLTEYQAGLRSTKKEVKELKNAVHSQTKRVATLSKSAKEMQDEIDRLQGIIEEADLDNLEEVLLQINNQLGSLFDNVGDIGQEIANLQDAIDGVNQFITDQGQINNDQELKNDEFEQRIYALENPEEGDS